MNVVYKSDKSKFKDGSEEKSGCIFCSSDFSHLIEKHRAVASRAVRTNAPRGGGNGAGGAVGAGGVGAAGGVGGPSRGGRHGNRAPKDKMAQLAAYFV